MQTTPTPLEKRVVFEQTVEGLFVRGLKGRISPQLRAELKAAGLDLDRKLEPAYPQELWLKLCHLAARSLFPGMPLPEAMAKLGARLVEGYEETFIGKALFAMARLLGPARALQRIKQNFRSGNNYSEGTSTELAPNHHELWVNELGDNRYISLGILRSGLVLAGAKDVVATIIRSDDAGATFDITWK